MEILDKQAMFIHDSRNAVLLGERQGWEKGREEGEKTAKVAIARSLLNKLTTEEISQATGLTIESINQLRKDT